MYYKHTDTIFKITKRDEKYSTLFLLLLYSFFMSQPCTISISFEDMKEK